VCVCIKAVVPECHVKPQYNVCMYISVCVCLCVSSHDRTHLTGWKVQHASLHSDN
jgi:hypothetical protein